MLAVNAFKIGEDSYQATCPYCNRSFQFKKSELTKKGRITCPKCPQGLGNGVMDIILPKEKKAADKTEVKAKGKK